MVVVGLFFFSSCKGTSSFNCVFFLVFGSLGLLALRLPPLLGGVFGPWVGGQNLPSCFQFFYLTVVRYCKKSKA